MGSWTAPTTTPHNLRFPWTLYPPLGRTPYLVLHLYPYPHTNLHPHSSTPFLLPRPTPPPLPPFKPLPLLILPPTRPNFHPYLYPILPLSLSLPTFPVPTPTSTRVSPSLPVPYLYLFDLSGLHKTLVHQARRPSGRGSPVEQKGVEDLQESRKGSRTRTTVGLGWVGSSYQRRGESFGGGHQCIRSV